MDKPSLRAAAMLRRDALDDRDRRSAAICALAAAHPAYAAARAIHCYLPMRSEVDTRPLIADALERGKRVAVPIVIPRAAELAHAWLESLAADALTPGVFGTFNPRDLRPARPGEWDVAIVPLLAFDRRGHRLGYGKGYYDRLLADGRFASIGVGFAAQEIDALPNAAHDIALDWIITEREIIRPRR
jgi:5-formyltetrahydrofolate cyclo-ligase